MIALLGLLAVAGYQNRDKLDELFGRITGRESEPTTPVPSGTSTQSAAGEGSGSGGILGELGGLFGGTKQGGGGVLQGALGDLVDSFTGGGHGETAKSWVETGPNKAPTTNQIEDSLGADAIESLTRQTGLSREELLTRLQAVLPEAVDKMTPEGRLPTLAKSTAMMSRIQSQT
jgi:uncharacterized protein YidB (DUF937 family)